MKKVKACDLKLRDVVKLSFNGYSTATIIKVEKNTVTVFRPYIHTSEVETTSGVTPYIGFEEFKIFRNNDYCNVTERQAVK